MLRRLLLIFIVLCLSLPAAAFAQQEDSPAKILAKIGLAINEADSLFRSTRAADTVVKYQAAVDLINENKDKPIFTKDKDLADLKLYEYRAALGLGRSTLYKLFQDMVGNDPTLNFGRLNASSDLETWMFTFASFGPLPRVFQWDYYRNKSSATQEDFTKTITLLEDALKQGQALPKAPDLAWGYLALATAYYGASAQGDTLNELDTVDIKGFDNYGLAGKAFEGSNPGMSGFAYHMQGLLAAAYMESDSANGHTRQEWFKLSLEAFQKAMPGLGSAIRYRGLAPVQVASALIMAYEVQIENGAITDPSVKLDDLDHLQIAYSTTIIAQYGQTLEWLTRLNQGIVRARIAWRAKDLGLAQNAINDLRAGIILIQRERAADKYGAGSDDNPGRPGSSFASSRIVYAFHYLGRLYTMLGRPDLALDMLQSAQEFGGNNPLYTNWPYGTPWVETKANNANDWLIGKNLTTLGRYREAVKKFQQMFSIRDFQRQAIYPDVMSSLSIAYQRLGMYYESIDPLRNRADYYQQVLNSTSDPAQQRDIQTALIDNDLTISVPLAVVGRTEEALTRLQEAVDSSKKLNEPTLLLNTTLRVADIYLQLDIQENALAAYRQAANLAQDLKASQQEGLGLLGQGRILVARELLPEANDALTKANQAMQTAKNSEGQVNALLALGNLALKGDQPDQQKAMSNYQQAFSIADKSADPRLTVAALEAIADLQATQKQPAALLTYYRGLVVARSIDNREFLAHLYAGLGQFLAQDNHALAVSAYANAVSVVEQTQRGFQTESLTSQFASNYAGIYASYIQLLFADSHYEQAFEITERARARAFLDQLAIGPVDLRQGASADLLEQESALRKEIDTTQDLLIKAQSEASPQRDYIARLRSTLQKSENDYAVLFTRIQAEAPALAALTGTEVASLPAVQSALGSDTTLLSYYTTENATYAFLVTQKSISGITLNVSRSQLSQAVSQFRADETTAAGLSDLYGWLVKPLVSQIHTSRLVVVPHNVLNYIPFAALSGDGKTILGDQFKISYLPSASTMTYLARKPTHSGKLLALGNPVVEGFNPLPFAEAEVNQVATLTGGKAYIGKDAKEALIWQQGAQAGVLYLAVHGTFNQRNPLFSALHLAEGDGDSGRLEAYKVYRLDLTQSTDLVVLSACDTAVGKLSAGDEFSSLNRAFLYAGSPAVIASLWSVDDKATAILMTTFFKARADGQDLPAALQIAQHTVRSYKDATGATPYVSPYYWAAFILTTSPN